MSDKRSTRVLTPLKDNILKKVNYAVCDIEVRDWINFLVIGFYDGKNYKYFKTLDGFFNYVYKSNLDCIYAHFGGIFDFIFLLNHALEKKWPVTDIIPRGSGILSLTIHRQNQKIIFRDSSAFLPMGLKRLTENFGVEHKKKEIDYSKIKTVTKELLEYLQYDCKGLYQCIQKFHTWPIIQDAGVAHTIAGQALRVFRTMIPRPIPAITSRIADAFVRKSYFGGRVEIFRPLYQGKKPLHCYDVNSLFPYIMSITAMPGACLGLTRQYRSDAMGFYYATATVPKNILIPPLPVKHNNKLIFPTGTFSGYWSHLEIEYAKTLGCEFKIERGLRFESAGLIFKQFIHTLWDIRTHSEPGSVDNILAKLIMNSCYGRFGLRREREGLEIRHQNSAGAIKRELKVGKHTYQLMSVPDETHSFSNVAISATVTAAARVYMHKTFYQKLGKDLYYTDTDSIFTPCDLDISNDLGGLKLEYSTPEACFLLPKTYKAGPKISMKGFDQKKIQHFTFEDFKYGLEGDLKHLKIIQEPKFAKLKTALNINKKLLTMTKGNEKSIRSKYDKRIIYKENGVYLTHPIHLEE